MTPTVRSRRLTASPPSLTTLLVKVVALGIVDAIAVVVAFVLFGHGEWFVATLALLTAAVLTWIYLRRGALPAKYLAPGTVFLLVFQLFVIGYSGYIAFTNYGDGHVGSKDDAVAVLITKSLTRIPDSPAYPMVVVERGGELSFLVTDPDGVALVGGDGRPLEPAPDADFSAGKAVALPGYTTLNFAQMLQQQTRIAAMSVPLGDDLDEGAMRTANGSEAYVYRASMHYEEERDVFVDVATGTVYADTGTGAFVSERGVELMPGWKVDVGFENFGRAITEESIRGPLLSVILWTFVFAGVTVAATFGIGVLLAMMLNDPFLRGRRIFRVLMILPYAFPAFLSALIWSGLLNPQFGFVNQVLLGGADIPWLTDPVLAKVSVLIVNVWLGYPYMFLVATGALQSIPMEYIEAAKVDGAGRWATFRKVTLPLLMVTMAPLLIASFAFNFNNFNVIYLLTEGGPQDISTEMNVGATDILITLVYKVAFGETSGRDYGLASAFAIIIFLLVAVISVLSFRKTKALEELH